MYTIEVKSSFEQVWRYNTMIMCGGYSALPEEKELYVVSERDIVSEIENRIECEPSGFELPHRLILTAEEADHIRVIIYYVPHTLPLGKEVENRTPFDVDVKISREGEVIYKKVHQINQWGGASIEIKI